MKTPIEKIEQLLANSMYVETYWYRGWNGEGVTICGIEDLEDGRPRKEHFMGGDQWTGRYMIWKGGSGGNGGYTIEEARDRLRRRITADMQVQQNHALDMIVHAKTYLHVMEALQPGQKLPEPVDPPHLL